MLKIVINGAAVTDFSHRGLDVFSRGTRIQGLVINGFDGDGISLRGPDNVVEGNFIGTDAAGTTAVRNVGSGVSIFDASGNTIGGAAAGARNVISGNDEGVDIRGGGTTPTTGNVVKGNFIGTDRTGTTTTGLDGKPLGNGDGVSILDFSNTKTLFGNTIGGTVAADRNVISGNGDGIDLWGTSSNLVQGNFIGTDRTGNVTLGNAGTGVNLNVVASPNNTIGGLTATPGQAPGNVIVGSGIGPGASTFGSSNLVLASVGTTGNLIAGNLIGLLANGTAATNTRNGVRLTGGPSGNTIGGSAAGARNVISGNPANGVQINGDSSDISTNNVVQGNFIGTDPTGTVAVPNGLDGVHINTRANNNTIGGTSPGQGNTIAFNRAKGVVVGDNVSDASTGNAILGNAIFANALLGIDLANDGVTLNDSSGHAGPNLFQDFPVLTSAVKASSGTTIGGTVHGPANSTIRVEVFSNPTADPSGYGQGRTFLGAVAVATNASGDGTFTLAAGAITPGSFVSATATDASNNTSEFSKNLRAGNEVTSQVGFRAFAPIFNRFTGLYSQTITLTNTSSTVISGPILLVLADLTPGVTLTNAAGNDPDGNPYVTASAGDLAPGMSVTFTLTYRKASPGLYVNYTPKFFLGTVTR